MRWLLLILLTAFATGAAAQNGIAPEDIRLELELESRAHPPHPGEMVLLKILGTYRVPVVRESLHQPPLEGFDWMQLGEDRWYKTREDGFEVLKLERRMALFPLRAGEIGVEPFSHGLEVLNRQGRTIAVEQRSNALSLAVAKPIESDNWWFPVRQIAIDDSWSNQPEALDPGGAALRIVTLTVEGAEPQLIPPMPELTGAGAHIFPHPEHKIVALGPDGPVTRVFWRWTIRPREGSAGYLNPMRLVYFDAEARDEREVMLAAQRVAHRDRPQEVIARETALPSQEITDGSAATEPEVSLPGWTLPASALLGIGIGLTALARNARGLRPWHGRDGTRSLMRDLRRAARRGEAEAVRALSHRLLTGRAEVPEGLRELDRALYGNGPPPDLKTVARTVLAAAQPPRRRAISPREGL